MARIRGLFRRPNPPRSSPPDDTQIIQAARARLQRIDDLIATQKHQTKQLHMEQMRVRRENNEINRILGRHYEEPCHGHE